MGDDIYVDISAVWHDTGAFAVQLSVLFHEGGQDRDSGTFRQIVGGAVEKPYPFCNLVVGNLNDACRPLDDRGECIVQDSDFDPLHNHPRWQKVLELAE